MRGQKERINTWQEPLRTKKVNNFLLICPGGAEGASSPPSPYRHSRATHRAQLATANSPCGDSYSRNKHYPTVEEMVE